MNFYPILSVCWDSDTFVALVQSMVVVVKVELVDVTLVSLVPLSTSGKTTFESIKHKRDPETKINDPCYQT